MRKDTLYGVSLVNFHPQPAKNSLGRTIRCHQTVTDFNHGLGEAEGTVRTPRIHRLPAFAAALLPNPEGAPAVPSAMLPPWKRCMHLRRSPRPRCRNVTFQAIVSLRRLQPLLTGAPPVFFCLLFNAPPVSGGPETGNDPGLKIVCRLFGRRLPIVPHIDGRAQIGVACKNQRRRLRFRHAPCRPGRGPVL